MILKKLSLVALLLSVSPLLSAQSIAKERVSYDPSFWDSELKLSPRQLKKIDEINYRFYQSIKEAALLNAGSNRSYAKELEKALHTRNEDIEQLFVPRQKRKWEKISKDFLHASHRTVSKLGDKKLIRGVF